MAEEHEYSKDPRAYELTVTLHEGDDLLYEAEVGLPEGFKIPETKPAAGFTPVALVAKRVSTKLKGVPAAPKGGADAAVQAVRLAWDFIKDNRPKATAEGASTAVLSNDDMAWDHYSDAKRFSTKPHRFKVEAEFLPGWAVVVDYVARGTYQAQYDGEKDVREGEYMPNIEVFCSYVKVNPGWNLNANAVLSHPSNIGPKGGRVIPDFNATLSFNCSWLGCCTMHTFSYHLRGDEGVVGMV